jgi:hypothetical protein
MAFGDAGRAFGYAVRSHKISATLLGLAVSLTLVISLFPRGAAEAASYQPPSVLTPSSGAYFGSWVAQRSGESREAAISRVESQIGRKFAIDHQYYKWDSPFPTSHESWAVAGGRIPMLNWKAQRMNGAAIPWRQIASGAEDAGIVARADAIKAFGYPVYLVFHHEPEDDLATWGQPGDFAAAWRHIVEVFRSRGVTNVGFVWTMMAWTFDPRSGKPINDYYPGDAYVDFIGSDGYNWYPMKSGAKWDSFQVVYQPTQNFAVAHGKPWIAVEWGAQEDPAVQGRKGQWLVDALATTASWPALKALVYFDELKDGYPWVTDSSSSSMAGYAQIGRSAYLNPGGAGAPVPTQAPSPVPAPTQAPSPVPAPTQAPSPAPVPSPTSQPSPAPTPTPVPAPTQAPSPAPVPTQGPSIPQVPVPVSVPAPQPVPVPVPVPVPAPAPGPIPGPPVFVNNFNGGSLGATLSGVNSSGSSGTPFDGVAIEGGASMVYDNTHSRGVGLAIRHTVGPRQNAFYRWDGSIGQMNQWFGRVYVWLDALPTSELRLVRTKTDGALGMAIDLMRDGTIRVRDGANRTIARIWTPFTTGSWIRIEWRVDHVNGQVDIRLFNSPNSTVASDSATSGPGRAIGVRSGEVQIGRSGTQPFSITFWTDDPAVSGSGYPGPAD